LKKDPQQQQLLSDNSRFSDRQQRRPCTGYGPYKKPLVNAPKSSSLLNQLVINYDKEQASLSTDLSAKWMHHEKKDFPSSNMQHSYLKVPGWETRLETGN